jgi:polyhydroxyalkanoate synthesis regulator phasin
MSRKQNPYHLWLGLPAENASPNFFQLLSIAPNADDNNQIAASARSNAQQLLNRLKNIPVKNDGEKAIREKLKTRIVKAHKTISDPGKRKQYVEALAAKHSISGVLPAVAPPTPPVSAESQPASPTPPVAPQPPPTPSGNTPANIPQAIPLAMPLDSSPQQPDAASNSEDPFAGISDEDTVRVRPVRARGKRSSIIPILVTLLIIAVIGGLVSLLAKYNNVFDVLAKRDQNAGNATTPAVPDPKTVTAGPNAANSDASSDAEPLKVPQQFKDLTDSQSKRRQDGSSDKNATDMSPVEIPATEEISEGSNSKANDTEEAQDASSADPVASATIARVAANMVRAALLRRDLPAAKAANERLNRLGDAEFLNGATKSLLKETEARNAHMIAHQEVFLEQLRSAAEELPGGQDIKVGSLIMGLLDAGPTEVTLRRAGRNEVIPYTDLPNSVAIALGEQGSKKSMPKWNMAKAADLIIHSQFSPPLKEKALPLLRQSISDGYDIECEAISAYGDMPWQQQDLPQERAADPTLDQVTAKLKEFRAANEYKNPKLVKAEMAPALLEKLLFSVAPSPEQRVARLSDAIAIAARQNEFDAVLVAAGELYELSNHVHVADMVVKPIDRCMRGDMTAAQARHLVHTIVAMVRQHSERRNFKKKARSELIRHARTLVEEFQFSELAPKVKQLAQQ